jgi:hypothetical protein
LTTKFAIAASQRYKQGRVLHALQSSSMTDVFESYMHSDLSGLKKNMTRVRVSMNHGADNIQEKD